MPARHLANSEKTFLVVAGDYAVARLVAAELETVRTAVVAGSASAGRRWLTKGNEWTGIIVDADLPDGSGLEVAAFARERFPLLPMLVLTGLNLPAVINRAQLLGAEFVCKPPPAEALQLFASRAVAFERYPENRVSRLVGEIARRSLLSLREAELLAVAVACPSRSVLQEQLGLNENTIKTQVRSLLRKTGFESLGALSAAVLREALQGGAAERESGTVRIASYVEPPHKIGRGEG